MSNIQATFHMIHQNKILPKFGQASCHLINMETFKNVFKMFLKKMILAQENYFLIKK